MISQLGFTYSVLFYIYVDNMFLYLGLENFNVIKISNLNWKIIIQFYTIRHFSFLFFCLYSLAILTFIQSYRFIYEYRVIIKYKTPELNENILSTLVHIVLRTIFIECKIMVFMHAKKKLSENRENSIIATKGVDLKVYVWIRLETVFHSIFIQTIIVNRHVVDLLQDMYHSSFNICSKLFIIILTMQFYQLYSISILNIVLANMIEHCLAVL